MTRATPPGRLPKRALPGTRARYPDEQLEIDVTMMWLNRAATRTRRHADAGPAAAHGAGPLAAALLLLACAAPAAAQEPAPAPAPDSVIALDSIVVEALHLPTTVSAAPWAVTVVDESRTQAARAGRGLAEVLHGVPGLQASDRSNDALGERIVVRGAGARAGFGVRGVRVLIDGIPATLPDGQTDLSRLDMATVGRVEILRGPASSLYGNASGGVLRISSAPPPEGDFVPELELLFGSFGMLRANVSAGGRPGLGWYDVDLTARENDGFREHSASSRSFARVAGGHPLLGGDLTVQLSANAYDADNPGSLSADSMAADRSQAHIANVRQDAGESAEQILGGATWTGAAGPGVLELMAYGTTRSLDNPIPVSIIELDRFAGGARALYGIDFGARAGAPLRADAPARPSLALAFGAELDFQHDDRRNFANEEGSPGDTTLDQLERVRALGLFGHTRIPLGARVDVTAGLRYDRFRFEVEDRLTDGDPDDSGERVLDALSPALGVHARLADAVHVYANLATAFETPTTTELANRPTGEGGFNPELEPQRTVSLEAGARLRTGIARWELAVWRAEVEDALVPFEVPGPGGRQFFRNAGSADYGGIEAALAFDFPRGLEWLVAYSTIDARFDDFTVDGESFAGNRVPGIAPHRLDFALTRRGPGWLAGLEVAHSANVTANDANTAQADGWTVVDLRAEVSVPGVPADVRAFAGVRNLLDAEYVGSVVVNAFGGRFFEPAPGRSIYLGASAGLPMRRPRR